MARVRFSDICDKCGARSPEYAAFQTCRICGDDICRRCTYDYDEPDAETSQWAECHECIDDELMIPDDALGAYMKLISASQYILFVQGELDSFNTFKEPRYSVIDTPTFVITEECHEWATLNAKKWMDYAAQPKGMKP